MENSEAKEFCRAHYVNYNAMASVMFKSEYAPLAAEILYKASKANSKKERWGHIYNGCIKSLLFPDLSVDNFWKAWTATFPDSIGLVAFRNGAYAVNKSFQRKNTQKDSDAHRRDRQISTKIAEVLNSILSPEETSKKL